MAGPSKVKQPEKTLMFNIFKCILISALLGCLLLFSCSVRTPNQCQLTTSPTIIVDRPGKILQYWDEANIPELWVPLKAPSKLLSAFRKAINNSTSREIKTILKNQLPLEQSLEDRQNISLTLSGKAGTIRPINCFESLMLEQQLARKPMITEPTEFLAMVLSKGSMLRIYFYSIDQPGIGNVDEIDKIVGQAVNDGFKVIFSLHNHNFFLKKANVQGGIAPSGNDVQVFRAQRESLGVEKALITNGFDTLVIDKDEFCIFKAVE